MKILLIVLGILALILRLPVGVDAGYVGALWVRIRIGVLTIPLIPGKRNRKSGAKKKRKAAASRPKDKTVREKRTIPVQREDITDGVKLLLRCIRKLQFQVSRFTLHFVSAFSDPYDTAMVYGYVCAIVNALQLERVKGADIQLFADFTAEQWHLECAASITIRIWYILQFVCMALAGGLPVLLRIRKRMKQTKNQFAQPAGKEA